MKLISALFVQKNGIYYGLDNVDPWDEERDAMKYEGPNAVVAHPPCTRWCRLAGLVEARYGYKRGEDGGMFKHSLNCVRKYGGVLEHPAYSDAWPAYDLPTPTRHGGWQKGFCGGWSCHVEQGNYGHIARKATWLYAFGTDLPSLKWGSDSGENTTIVSRLYRENNRGPYDIRRRISSKEASATPLEFRDLLLRIAKSVTEN